MEDHGCVEFYVASNPPLLPSGLRHFMEELQKSDLQVPNEKVIEILYEPSNAWFKIITFAVFKTEVSNKIASLLAAIAEQNTFPLEKPEYYSGSIVDVRTKPFFTIPWSAFSATPGYCDNFVAWQFPSYMQKHAFKTIWPLDSNELDFDLDKMLNMLSRLLDWSQSQDDGFDSLAALADLLDCEISHNISKTMLYIGTSSSQEAVHNARLILDSLRVLTEHAETIKHVIYTNEEKEQFCYKWLSHVGLDSRTYPQDLRDNERLKSAVSIRTVAQNAQGSWVIDEQSKPKARNKSNGADPDRWLTTSFLQHKYPPKKAQKSNCNSGVSKNPLTSRPSPRENHKIDPQSYDLIGMDEPILFDKDQPSRSNQHILASLLDDDPPANLTSSLLGPSSSEPKLAKARNPSHIKPFHF
ncbi:hypothetical protein E4U41_004505 [Claviceps citrina]|nr:hypothetical protein E4U41_004505 [Claviceps citrina]